MGTYIIIPSSRQKEPEKPHQGQSLSGYTDGQRCTTAWSNAYTWSWLSGHGLRFWKGLRVTDEETITMARS